MAGTCTTQVPDSVCIPTEISAELFHNGPAPQGFAEQIRQAIIMWPFRISGLLGIGSLVVTEVPDDGSTPAPVATPAAAPTAAPITDRDGPVSGIEDNAPSGGDSVNPGAFVAAGVAGLILIIVALFVVRRRRNNSDESLSKHRELGDDDDDGGLATDEDDETMQNVTIDSTPPRKSYVVGEEESLRSWDSRGANGQEVYVASPAMDYQHSPHHECSSPTCEACEMKRQQGTRFVMADSGIDTPTYLPAESDRNYEQEDTVDL